MYDIMAAFVTYLKGVAALTAVVPSTRIYAAPGIPASVAKTMPVKAITLAVGGPGAETQNLNSTAIIQCRLYAETAAIARGTVWPVFFNACHNVTQQRPAAGQLLLTIDMDGEITDVFEPVTGWPGVQVPVRIYYCRGV